MLNALTEAVAIVQPPRAVHEADPQRSTRDDRSRRGVPLSPPASALRLQVSALQAQLSAFKPQSPLSHSVQKRLNNACLPRIQRLFLQQRPQFSRKPAASFDRLTNGGSVSRKG
jgi:hypothetical protein